MVTLTTGSQYTSAVATDPVSAATPAPSISSFTEQLAAALEDYLNQSGTGSHYEIDIDASQGQDPGTRQFVVTLKDPIPVAAPAATPAQDIPQDPAPVVETPASAASVPTASTPAPTPASDVSAPQGVPVAQRPAYYYWQAQPPAVRELAGLSGDERVARAQELANQGYLIDVPIMVWGWDPYLVMKERQEVGYTWVDSMNRQGNESMPGHPFVGMTPYDPFNPPSGSIPVSLDFAKGLDPASSES
jgi:hypothetical protein